MAPAAPLGVVPPLKPPPPKRPPTPDLPSFEPHAFSALANLELPPPAANPPLPAANPLPPEKPPPPLGGAPEPPVDGVLEPPVGGVPEPPLGAVKLPVVPVAGRPPPKPPAPRLGRVTPCCLRQASNAVRLELVAADVALAFWLDAVLELEPHAATPNPAASETSITAAPRGARFAGRMVSVVLS